MDENAEILKVARKDAFRIIWQTIESIDSEAAIKKHVRIVYDELLMADQTIKVDNFNNIYVIGAGKASASMAKAIEDIFLKRLTGGLICVNYGYDRQLHKILVAEAGHPVPDENSFLAAKKTMEMAKECKPNDLLICLLSGGASAIWSLPHPPISFREKQRCIEALLGCGANIHELNTIRKHISRIKGGRLAKAAYPTRIITLAISDVVGDHLSSIGSGPTVADPSTYEDALEIINKYNLNTILPKTVLDHIWAGVKKEKKETPKPGDPLFKNNIEHIVSSNRLALESACNTAHYLGYEAKILDTGLTGEAREVGRNLIKKAKSLARGKKQGSPPQIFFCGGETTVTLKGEGRGGRNQELVLAAAQEMGDLKNVVIVSFGTDGIDGPTDAAGAFTDYTTVARGQELGLNASEFLDNNNSYEYFDQLGNLIKIGPTKTNVMDIQMLIIY